MFISCASVISQNLRKVFTLSKGSQSGYRSGGEIPLFFHSFLFFRPFHPCTFFYSMADFLPFILSHLMYYSALKAVR